MTPWTIASQAPLSMEFSRQEYWSVLSSPSPGDLPDSGIELGSPALQADSLLTEPPGKPKHWKKNNFLQLLKYLPITLLCGKLQTSKKAVEVYTLQFNCPCIPKRSESKINGIWELHIIKFKLWGLKDDGLRDPRTNMSMKWCKGWKYRGYLSCHHVFACFGINTHFLCNSKSLLANRVGWT